MLPTVFGRPGILRTATASYRNVFRNFDAKYYPGSELIIDGTKTRNPFTTRTTDLQPGLLLGQITASKKLANAVLGVTQGAITGAATSLTLTAAQATELVRRVGTTGTFKLTGPPTAAGTVRTLTVTYSAVNTTTGVVTITALGVSDVWTLTAPAGTDGGTYQLEVTTGLGTAAQSTQTTAALAANANSATVDAAVEALSNVGASGVTAVYADPTLTLTFASNLGPVFVRVLADTTNDGGAFEGGWSPAHTTTGVDGRFVAGSFAQPTDGSETILTFIGDGLGFTLTVDDPTDLDFPLVPIAGTVDPAQLLPWPADSSLKDWVRTALAVPGARFTWADKFPVS